MAQRTSPQTATADIMQDTAKDQQQRTSNLARIRDNQRRSRARRKEYLEDLENKLRSCKQLGIEASAEIQAAARRVVDENKRLRQLLKRQGFSDAEIDSLAHDQQPDSPSQCTSAGTLESMLGSRKACQCDDDDPPSDGPLRGQSVDAAQSLHSSTDSPIGAPFLRACSTNNHQPSPVVPSQSYSGDYHHLTNPHSVSIPSSLNAPINADPYTYLPAQQQQQPPMLPSSVALAGYDIGFDEPTGWLMGYDPLPASATAAATTAPGSPALHLASTEHDNNGGAADAQQLDRSTSSCIAAADLIRTVKPNIGLAELERELGCADGGDCKVPLAQIFTIMNRVAAQRALD